MRNASLFLDSSAFWIDLFSNPKEVALDFQKRFIIWELLLLAESSTLLRIQGAI